jgi:transcriptional regulator with XRE-family HTH domain
MSEPESDSPTPHLAVAAEVRAHLARRRMSGRQAAFALGWKQPYIARRISGEIPFDVNDLSAVADLLEVPVSSFFDGWGGPALHREGRVQNRMDMTVVRPGEPPERYRLVLAA